MTTQSPAEALLNALALPPQARVELRIPKKTLLEQPIPTNADRRLLQDGIDDLRWLAVLKPTTVGLPAWEDPADGGRTVLEVAVVATRLRPAIASPARLQRVLELLHRAIPYPLVLLTELPEPAGAVGLSLATKRLTSAARLSVVLDELRYSGVLAYHAAETADAAFWDALALGAAPAPDLRALYQRWVDALVALDVARLTQRFRLPASPQHGVVLREALAALARLRAEYERLGAQARREKQLNRRADLNLRLQQLKIELDQQLQALA